MKKIIIKEADDFERVRYINEEELILVLKSDIIFDKEFKPISKEECNIIILGNGKKIINLSINRPMQNYNGIFSKVKNLAVRDLQICDANIVSGEVCGVLAGEVEEVLSVKNTKVNSNINADSITGGLVGIAGFADISNCVIGGKYSARGIIGGLVGMCDRIKTKNNRYENVIIDTKGYREKDTLGIEVGYLSSEKEEKITRMLQPLMKDKKSYYCE